jgi:hypothetical protein
MAYLLKIEENAQFFLNWFWLQHLEFSTKLKIETMLSFKINCPETIILLVGPPYSKIQYVQFISAMLGFVKRLSTEFRDPYTLKALYVLGTFIEKISIKMCRKWFIFTLPEV